MKKIVVLVLMLILCMVVAGCGDANKVASKAEQALKSVSSSNTYGDLMHDKAALEKAIADMKEKAGSPLKVASIVIKDGYLEVQRQDQQNSESLDAFVFEKNQWSKQPVKLSGPGKLSENVGNFENINIALVSELVKKAEEKTKAEGFDNPQTFKVDIEFDLDSEQFVYTVNVSNHPNGVVCSLTADQSGKETNFRNLNKQ